MAWSGSPKTIGPGTEICYNITMTKRLQTIMDWVAAVMANTETRWLTLILTIFFILICYAVGLSGLGQLTAMIYVMYFVTFWRRDDR